MTRGIVIWERDVFKIIDAPVSSTPCFCPDIRNIPSSRKRRCESTRKFRERFSKCVPSNPGRKKKRKKKEIKGLAHCHRSSIQWKASPFSVVSSRNTLLPFRMIVLLPRELSFFVMNVDFVKFTAKPTSVYN